MKLLFDQNLSRNLVQALSAVYPDSSHVALCGLETADDRAVWDYAKENGFAIVSKDMDFNSLGLLHGAVDHDNQINSENGDDCFEAVRTALSKLQEDAPVITAEMAGAILDQAKELLDRAISFVVYSDAFSVVGDFHGDGGTSALTLTGRRLERSDDDSVLKWVIDEGRSYRGRLKDGAGNLPLQELIGDDPPDEVIVVPVIVDNQVAAVLYGDHGRDSKSIGHTGDLERVVARVAREMRTFRFSGQPASA